MDWRCGSSSGAPALQLGNPSSSKKKKNSLIQNVNRTEVKKPGLEWAQMTPQ
jgi:hypothetical protein